ncbi:MAG: hypothetical protein ABI769_17495 [Pseudomonadota bacterium]
MYTAREVGLQHWLPIFDQANQLTGVHSNTEHFNKLAMEYLRSDSANFVQSRTGAQGPGLGYLAFEPREAPTGSSVREPVSEPDFGADLSSMSAIREVHAQRVGSVLAIARLAVLCATLSTLTSCENRASTSYVWGGFASERHALYFTRYTKTEESSWLPIPERGTPKLKEQRFEVVELNLTRERLVTSV